MRRAILFFVLLLGPSASSAQDARQQLPPEGLPNAASTWVSLRYAGAFEQPLPNDHRHAVAIDLRSRFLLGGPVAYLFGIDGSIGGSDAGLVYELEAHVLGIAARWDVGMVGLSGGIGLGGVTESIPIGAQIPIELFGESNLGPVRILGAVTVRFVLGADERTHGSPLLEPFDEVGAALYLRAGDERRLWGNTVAGWGPAIGFFYRERMHSRIVGVALSLSLSGGA